MKLESTGIIIELKPFGARDSIGRVFTSDFGVLGGIFKAGQIAKNKPLTGQFGKISWNARIDSQLGAFHFENEKNLTAGIFSDCAKLRLANSCFELLSAMLPEREAYPKLFDATLQMLQGGACRTAAECAAEYQKWELGLLADLGYGLALDKCGNCGMTGNLAYISPKTGRAICEKCGAEYADKLFAMPASLDATKYFLEQIADLPTARKII